MTYQPVALVTGATRGIGRAVAAELSTTHRILVGGRDQSSVAQLVTELDDAAPFVCDLTREDEVAEACAGITRLDVLVHSAGVVASGKIGAASRELWREVFETNVFAVADLTRLLLPALEAAKGLVIAINSGAGFTSSPGGWHLCRLQVRSASAHRRTTRRGARHGAGLLHPSWPDGHRHAARTSGRGGQ